MAWRVSPQVRPESGRFLLHVRPQSHQRTVLPRELALGLLQELGQRCLGPVLQVLDRGLQAHEASGDRLHPLLEVQARLRPRWGIRG